MAGDIRGITIEFRGDPSPLQKALRTINGETAKLDKEISQVNKNLKFNPKSIDMWKQKQELLTNRISETKEKLDLLRQTQAKVDSGEIEMTAEDYRKLERDIAATESRLKSFESELRKIGNANLRALSEQFKEIGGKMMDVGKTLTTHVTLPLAAVGTVAATKFAEVDKTMQLTNSTMGNTKEQADLLNKAMKDAAASSTFGMNDAATATLNFARAGLSAEEAAAALAPAMALAAGEGGELDTVSAGLVATINGFHGSFDDAAAYADIFANACNNSALDVNSLSNAMSIAAPIFSSAGYKVKDAALFMGVMANNGIEANKAANSLKTGIARLVSPSKEGADMMDKLGISITNADGTMKDSVQIQKELHDAFGKLSESEQIAAASAIFGKNQMAPWLALINTAPEDVEELSLALDENGTALEMQASMMQGFGGSIEKLKSGIDVAATSLGEALAPVIMTVANGIQKLVDWFNALSPAAQTVIATIGVIAAAAGPLLIVVGAIASGIGSILGVAAQLIPMLSGVGAAISGVVSTFGLWGIAIAAAIAAGIYLYKHWDEIKAKIIELKNKFAEGFNAIKTSITTAIENAKKSLAEKWDSIKSKAEAVWNALKTAATTVWNAIKTAVTTPIDTLKTELQTKWEAIKTTATTAWNALKSAASTAWNAIKSAMTKPIEDAEKTLKGIINTIKGWFPISIGNVIGDLKLPHFTISGKFSINPPSVPHFSVSWYKQGGIFDAPTIAGIGEAGPEAVVPLDKFWDAIENSNRQTEALLMRQNQILLQILSESMKEKDFRVDGMWAGRYINSMVRG